LKRRKLVQTGNKFASGEGDPFEKKNYR